MDRRIWKAAVLLFACVGIAGCLGKGTTDTPMLPPPATTVVSPTAMSTEMPTLVPTLPPTVTFTPTSLPPTATQTPVPPPPTPTRLPTTSPQPPAEEPYYEDRTGPTSLLTSYYNAINRQEYARAWGYWENPPNPSYEDFVQGFADTVSVRLALRPPTWFEGAAGSTYTRVPVLLRATHVDGNRHNFVGCFVARRPNVDGPGVDREWSLYEATVRSATGNSADALLLTEACEPAPETSYDDQTGPVRLLASYYNAINLGEYTRAWEYWETPPDSSFEGFAEGFADTESVMLVVRPPTRSEGAAGSTYVAIPTLLSATHVDGSRHNYLGCFVTRRPNVGRPGVEQEWWLFDATVQRSSGNTTDVTALDQACDTR